MERFDIVNFSNDGVPSSGRKVDSNPTQEVSESFPPAVREYFKDHPLDELPGRLQRIARNFERNSSLEEKRVASFELLGHVNKNSQLTQEEFGVNADWISNRYSYEG